MKKLTAILLAALMLCSIFSAATAVEIDSYADLNSVTPDPQTYPGTWQQAYCTILNNHSANILAYQNRKLEFTENGKDYSIPFLPVALMDLTSDGIPELIFIELAYMYETVGDLYIYTSTGNGAKCMLTIPGITRPDYDPYGLGFNIYLSSHNGSSLVTEFYEYETFWMLEFIADGQGRYYMINNYTEEIDNSGESDGTYLWNGIPNSYETCLGMLNDIRSKKTMIVSDYIRSDRSAYGLHMTLESAIGLMGGTVSGQTTTGPTPEPVMQPVSGDVYGYTIDKLATRKGPGTQYEGGGTYSVKNQYIKVLAKAWDKRNGIWWVKCEIPYHGEIRVLWTGWKRFDHSTISLDDLPEEIW